MYGRALLGKRDQSSCFAVKTRRYSHPDGRDRRAGAYQYPLDAMKTDGIQATLRRLLPERHVEVRSPDDFSMAMRETADHRGWKKTLLDFHWE